MGSGKPERRGDAPTTLSAQRSGCRLLSTRRSMGKFVRCQECGKVYRDPEELEELRDNDSVCMVCNAPIEVADWDRILASWEDEEDLDDVDDDLDEDWSEDEEGEEEEEEEEEEFGDEEGELEEEDDLDEFEEGEEEEEEER
jgi:hypothetical protein